MVMDYNCMLLSFVILFYIQAQYNSTKLQEMTQVQSNSNSYRKD